MVTEADVAQVVSKWTGVPVEKVNSDESARLVQLEAANSMAMTQR